MTQLETHKGYYLWKYVPSIPAAAIFLVLFLACTTAHIWRMYKTKTWFCTVFVLGGIFEVVGYIGRFVAHNSTGKLMPYIIQSLFILLAPSLFAASIYMVLGRIIRSVKGEKHSIIRVQWLTRVFVTADVVSFVIQGGAAGLMVGGGKMANLGSNIVIAGLVTQVISFGLFIVTAVIFQTRIKRLPTPESYNDPDIPWKKLLTGLYAMSTLVIIRSIFRVIEYSMGNGGYPLQNEWTLYVFDSVPMFFVMVIFYLYYPSQLKLAPKDSETGEVDMISYQGKGSSK